jgi:hypothetical protein
VKRIQANVLFLLALALVVPAAYAGTASHPKGNAQSEKAAKDYNKQINKTLRQQAKAQKKLMKAYQKQHPEFQGYGKSR